MSKLLVRVIVVVVLFVCLGCERREEDKAEIKDYHYSLINLPYEKLSHQYTYIKDTIHEIPADSNGVKLYQIGNKYYYHPVMISNKTLDAISDYRLSNDVKYLNHAIISAETLRSKAIRYKGGIYFPYTFDYNILGKPELFLKQPWISGMSQGMLLSIYSRLYYVTQNELYHAVADSILTTLNDYSSPYSPVFVSQADQVGLGSGYYWVDEYPHPTRVYVLNGSIIGAMGLYDHWWVFRDNLSAKLLSRELTTVKDHVMLYRNPDDISFYDLRFKTKQGVYQIVHVNLMLNCFDITGDPYFLTMKDLFSSDYHQ